VATVSLAAVTSSYLGDTARNIESIFQFAERTPCVLLFDEFDVLGQERAQERDHGELRRVAATVLQLLEETQGESIVVATSNHPQLVDSAAWRRFDELIGFGRLDVAQLARLIDLKLRAVPADVDPEAVAARMMEFSPAEVEMVCLDAMRRAVLTGSERVDESALVAAAKRMRQRPALVSKPGHGSSH
jgi:SpoVK/Ycf46/Vps4 family AAA+-type ATPase